MNYNQAVDHTGKKFGDWIAIKYVGNRRWICACSCGKRKQVNTSSLTSGKSTSCGCKVSEKITKVKTTHGYRKHKLYRVWQDIKDRCNNPNHKGYQNYGGRGITICDEWQNSPKLFIEWCLENGWDYFEGKGKRNTTLIDRKDNDKGYCPDNCRFIDNSVSRINTRLNKDNTSGYRGVYYHKSLEKYQALVIYKKERFNIGTFDTAKEAAIARNNFIEEKIKKYNWPHKLTKI